MNNITEKVEGGCGCGHVRFQIATNPLVVHCCHCSYCQRQTGSAFVINALYEASKVKLLSGETEIIDTPSPSGLGQYICRCPKCKVAVWSNYYMGGIREMIRFIRVGTLDDPNLLPPDVHIFVETKQKWVSLSPETPTYNEFYEWADIWTEENRSTLTSLRAKAERLKTPEETT